MRSPPLWRQIQKTNFVHLAELSDYLDLSQELRKQLLDRPNFPLNLPRRLAGKIAKNKLDDPLFLQFVPLKEETIIGEGSFLDPVGDVSFKKTPKLIQKYKGRSLILSTSGCAMHCRYCFRQNFPYEKEVNGFDAEIEYLEQNREISEIILSGGDPLSLSDEVLERLLNRLERIPHIRRVRFHSRFLIGIPERISKDFLDILRTFSKQIIFVIHCNHPREIDSDVIQAIKAIQMIGIPILNQSVLLRGVNDDENTLLHLSETLIDVGVVPYYLHQLDLVKGSGHFAISDARASQLVRFIQENVSGFAVPRLAREEPGMPSKTFISLEQF